MKGSTPCTSAENPQRSERAVRRITTATVALLAVIAATVSYRHLHMLAVRHGESAWSAALLPLSVDGMILASSMALLADSRRGKRGGFLPWTLLIVGSLASVAANIAVAQPSFVGRAVAAWPAFALIGSLEMAFRLVRQSVVRSELNDYPQPVDKGVTTTIQPTGAPREVNRGHALQREAWRWATENRGPDGSLPCTADLAQRFHRSARWARLVKAAGTNGTFS